MNSFRVDMKDSKSYAIYMEDNGRYYVMYVNWWEKRGIHVANGKRRISKQIFEQIKSEHNM